MNCSRSSTAARRDHTFIGARVAVAGSDHESRDGPAASRFWNRLKIRKAAIRGMAQIAGNRRFVPEPK